MKRYLSAAVALALAFAGNAPANADAVSHRVQVKITKQGQGDVSYMVLVPEGGAKPLADVQSVRYLLGCNTAGYPVRHQVMVGHRIEVMAGFGSPLPTGVRWSASRVAAMDKTSTGKCPVELPQVEGFNGTIALMLTPGVPVTHDTGRGKLTVTLID